MVGAERRRVLSKLDFRVPLAGFSARGTRRLEGHPAMVSSDGPWQWLKYESARLDDEVRRLEDQLETVTSPTEIQRVKTQIRAARKAHKKRVRQAMRHSLW